MGEYNPGDTPNPGIVETTGAGLPNANRAKRKLGLALLPFSPAPLTGEDAIYGWGRLAVYGGLTYLTWKRSRKLRYVFAGATGVSLASSLSATAWGIE